MREDLKDVGVFLQYVRECLDEGRWTIWTNRKNKDFQTRYGLRREDIKDEIRNIHPRQVAGHPMDDEAMAREAGTVFVFLKHIQHEREVIPVYIKIKVPDEEPGCVVLSFHESL